MRSLRNLTLFVAALPLLALAQDAMPAAPAPGVVSVALVHYVLPALGSVLALIIGALGAFAVKWIDAKTSNEKLSGAVAWGTTLAHDAISYVDARTKTTVGEISADGVITPAEAQRLQREALEAFKSFAGEKGLATLGDGLKMAAPALEKWVVGRIQSVYDGKKNARTLAESGTAPTAQEPVAAVVPLNPA